MSPDSYQLFNTWFPAIVVGLVISLLAAVLWDLLRRKTWCFASRLWPGILKEVGLDTSSPSRAEVEERNQEISEALSKLSSQITKALLPAKSSMAETIDSTSFVSSKCGTVTGDFDLEAQTGINPVYTPGSSTSITFTATAYFPDDTPMVIIRPAKKFFRRYSKGTVKRWKSSIVLQASLPIDPCVLAEIGDLAKHCMHKEYRCTFQLGNWAILYCNAGEVRLHMLKEGDVPVNVEARWQVDRTSITMRGLYLNGAQVKAATKQTSTILRSVGPATQGPGELDELHFPIAELDVPGEDSLIFAAKIVEADGVSLIVRSEASFILPAREKFSFIEALWGQLEWISSSAREMTKSFLRAVDRRPELRICIEHTAKHWKGMSKVELLAKRLEVLLYLHKLRESGIVDGASSQPPDTHLHFIRDVEYWQRGLQDVNEVLLQSTGRLQSGTHISIRGGMKFLCGDFEGALQDLDLAYQIMRENPSTVLVERALVKCMLARYSEALEDVGAVIAINPNENSIQELQTCIQQILDQRTPIRRNQGDQEPRLSDQGNRMVTIPDLLTGDEWPSGEIESPCTMSDDSTGGGLIVDRSSMHLKSADLAQPTDVAMAFKADTQREVQVSSMLAEHLGYTDEEMDFEEGRFPILHSSRGDDHATASMAYFPAVEEQIEQSKAHWSTLVDHAGHTDELEVEQSKAHWSTLVDHWGHTDELEVEQSKAHWSTLVDHWSHTDELEVEQSKAHWSTLVDHWSHTDELEVEQSKAHWSTLVDHWSHTDELEVEQSKAHWSTLVDHSGHTDEAEVNFEMFQEILANPTWGSFFATNTGIGKSASSDDTLGGLVLGKKIADGAQAEIYEMLRIDPWNAEGN